MGAQNRFFAFYAALFAAFGVASPFLPGLLQQNGLGATALGVVLAAGTAVRLLTGPLGGRLADRTGRAAVVLAAFAACSAAVALGYVPARGLLLVTAVSVAHAAVLAPLVPVADALTLAAGGVRYGWVRGAGSAAFVAATLAAGVAVDHVGLGVIVWLNAGLLLAAALLAPALPDGRGRDAADKGGGAARELLAIPGFALLMGTAALIGGSHAMHDGFEVVRWRTAGMSGTQAGVLWGASVLAEVGVFATFGPALVRRLGPGGALMLAATAGMVRWGAAALTALFPVMLAVEPLHGLTFAVAHLACMARITDTVPAHLAATAQAAYGTVALGAAGAVVTLASGPLYGWLGAPAFWAMAALCAAAVPLALRLRRAAVSET